jgi:hypothetical protein
MSGFWKFGTYCDNILTAPAAMSLQEFNQVIKKTGKN